MSFSFVVLRAGVEPATSGLEVPCSIQLSYRSLLATAWTFAQTHEVITLSRSPSLSSRRCSPWPSFVGPPARKHLNEIKTLAGEMLAEI